MLNKDSHCVEEICVAVTVKVDTVYDQEAQETGDTLQTLTKTVKTRLSSALSS